MKRRSSKVIRRRRERDICKSHEPLQEIPFDLVIDILTRLPPKSIMRFKSVSKLWSSLICSKYFSNRFREVSSPRPRLFMWLGIDNKNVLLSSSSSPDLDVSTMSSLVVDQDLTIPTMEGYSVSQVFHGLMCFTNGKSALIYNTATRQHVVLPAIEESIILGANDMSKSMFCIGYDSVHDQYKVFCTVSKRGERVGNLVIWVSEHWVFVLGGGDVSSRWRNIPSSCLPHRPLTQFNTININGRMLYYLARAHLPKCVLVSFDMISEEISVPQLPEDLVLWSRLPILYEILEWDGRVAFLYHPHLENDGDDPENEGNVFDNEGVMKVWVMEDAEKNQWSSKTLVLPPYQMKIFNIPMVVNLSLKPRGTTGKGEVILVPRNIRYCRRTRNIIIGPQETNHFYIFLYSLQKNHMRKVEITKSSSRYLTTKWDVIGLDDVENLMYL
ncbi:F-box protein [Hirschfeldia incana]|nr:F-box protein [Hirschfeldia incana]